jgi:hypothetical protein
MKFNEYSDSNMLLLNEKQADTIFCDAGEECCHKSLSERISKQRLLSTYPNDVSLRIKSF